MPGAEDLGVSDEATRQASSMGGAFECGSLKQRAESCEAGEAGAEYVECSDCK